MATTSEKAPGMAKSKVANLHATHNDLGANGRDVSVGVLDATRADTADLLTGLSRTPDTALRMLEAQFG